MEFRIIHEHRDSETATALERIERTLLILQFQGDMNMGKLDDLKIQIAEIGNDITEIDGDIQGVLDKLVNPPADGLTSEQTEEITTLLRALKGRTRAAADKVS